MISQDPSSCPHCRKTTKASSEAGVVLNHSSMASPYPQAPGVLHPCLSSSSLRTAPLFRNQGHPGSWDPGHFKYHLMSLPTCPPPLCPTAPDILKQDFPSTLQWKPWGQQWWPSPQDTPYGHGEARVSKTLLPGTIRVKERGKSRF